MHVDLAAIPRSHLLCFSGFGGDLGASKIVCIDPTTSTVKRVVDTPIPSSRAVVALAYDPDADLFVVQHHRGVDPILAWGTRIDTLTGLRHDQPGQRVSSCTAYLNELSGQVPFPLGGPWALGTNGWWLAYQPGSQTMWTTAHRSMGSVADPKPQASLVQVDPGQCAPIRQIPTDAAWLGSAQGIRPDGTLLTDEDWLMGRAVGTFVDTTATGDNLVNHTPWLTLSDNDGVTKGGNDKSTITVNVDRSQIPAGVDRAYLVLRGNGGAEDDIEIPLVFDGSKSTASTVSAKVQPTKYGKPAVVRVSVAGGNDPVDDQVTVSEGGRRLGTATLRDGRAIVMLPAGLRVGQHKLVVRYAGDVLHQPSADRLSLSVRKASTTVIAKGPQTIRRHRTIKIRTTVNASQALPNGKVKVVWHGKTLTQSHLKGGHARLRMARALPPGRQRFTVVYLGNGSFTRSTATVPVRITR